MSCEVSSPIIHSPNADGQADWRRWIELAPAVITAGGGGGGRVLLISYTFPPTGGSGVQRPAKLAKYLPQFGWTVEVLSAGHDRFPWHDPTLLDDVPSTCRIHRVAGLEPACLARAVSRLARKTVRLWPRANTGDNDEDLVVHPKPLESHRRDAGATRVLGFTVISNGLDWFEERIYWKLAGWTDRLGLGNGESLWIGAAARAALRRHRQQPFDAIVSTGPPVFVHRVAMRLADATGLPWVADVRDPFVSDHGLTGPDGRHLVAMSELERTVLEKAALVVTTCESLADDFRRRYPRSNIQAIINGFDRDDLVSAIEQDPDRPAAEAECTLAAAGAFYGQRELARLVESLTRVMEWHTEWHGRVRLVVAGTLDARQRRQWETERPEWMTLAGYLDHVSVINLVRASSCAVLIVPDCGHTRLCLPAKMFELAALPVHVLGLIPPQSETERLLLAAGACTVAPYEDAAGVASALERVISDALAGRLCGGRNWPAMDAYDRRSLAARWAECLAVVCGRHDR